MDDHKKQEEEEYLPFQDIDKGQVLQETKIFSHAPKTKRSYHLLTKILYLIIQGNVLTTKEATDVFFAVTKLFQAKDVQLRRMVYMVLKELTGIAEDTIMATASLCKDINSEVDSYKANAIRVISRIIDPTMLGQIERYLKQAIVDKDPYVSSAALVSGFHLMSSSGDVVRRWIGEVQEAMNSRSVMVQYHALGLLHRIRRKDKHAIVKLVASLTRGTSIRSPFANCLLIRFVVQVIESSTQGPHVAQLYEYLESCLRHKSEIVVYEAARAICNLKDIEIRNLSPAVTVLQLFLSSPKTTIRFAAVRTLNNVATTHPHLVARQCSFEMENLISDVNRSIATLAITTLLKVEAESSIDRLLKQIATFINEISDEFKIVVVDAIRTLALKFKQRHYSIMAFLANMLRDEGGFAYKRAIVDTILTIIAEIPDSKETGLSHLCEFIEDCEYPYLSSKILHLLGKEGAKTSSPAKYIRYIYNRIILEGPTVRASAVSALAKFGINHEALRTKVIILLKRCLLDTDDEVRDRATFYLSILEDHKSAKALLVEELGVPLTNMELSLREYLDAGPKAERWSIENVPAIPLPEPKPVAASQKPKPGQRAKPVVIPAPAPSLSQFTGLGPLFRSTEPVALTELETEYVVHYTKHLFQSGYVVLQFDCKNTLEEQLLEEVTVDVVATGSNDFTVESTVMAPSIGFDETKQILVKVKMNVPATAMPFGTFTATLKFTTKDVDVDTGLPDDDSGYQDDYQLENVEIRLNDYILGCIVPNFKPVWDSLQGSDGMAGFKLATMHTCQAAVKQLITFWGMQACERSDQVPSGKKTHTLFFAGKHISGVQLLGVARMKVDPKGSGMLVKLMVRSEDPELNKVIANALYA